ncbi:uncharacterized protein DSM5745_00737 [Aspergillus mulundensis]|uniref:BPP domain-containing protein n=1 Tax=Aspergillus mulundensis TaxID=1810919 RepID=A0A3D8T4D6_9EURO|nr:Uncharacterized protein DSM5745_00737 [Aspergillus mulundensis]RDW93415.1 Uncharacterized protein DSM5745_00737 [Aspergillus mulundensis]
MRLPYSTGLLLALGIGSSTALLTANLHIASLSTELESDQTTFYYGLSRNSGLLIGNDGSAATGGLRSFNFHGLNETSGATPGRTKVLGVLYGNDHKDIIVSIAAPDSVIRVFDVNGLDEIPSTHKKALGDWSALCTWTSPSGGKYFYLFGKKKAIQFLVRTNGSQVEIFEVQTFPLSVEPSSCTVSPRDDFVYFAAEDDTVYRFTAAESTTAPEIETLGLVSGEISGLSVYVSRSSYYLFVTQEDIIEIYTPDFEPIGSLTVTGAEDIEIAGTSIYQSNSTHYPYGLLGFAIESDSGNGFGVASLKPAFTALGLQLNTSYTPRKSSEHGLTQNGFLSTNGTLSCFAGFAGSNCTQVICRSGCSAHGACIGPNECKCDSPWAGPDCSWIEVPAKYETDANGGDGDDPAIWVNPTSPNLSTIITTTKSEIGAGLAVFDLKGKLLQTMAAGEPNNVDVMYAFRAGNRTVDLAYAACRQDDTLCLFEVTSDGLLTPISGGVQPTPDDYTVYGSCTYRSPLSGKQYLFVNEKSGTYLQYELTSSPNGTLATSLVRSFTGGSGGQPEGCVPDEENGYIFLGEEPYGLWRYDAEPHGSNNGTLVAKVGDGTLHADVEGVTLLPGKTPEQGLLVVSCQGVSAYSVYRRQAPHEHVLTFTIGESEDGVVDGVTNTDGVAGLSTGLNEDFPHGLLVVHDDANQLADGGTAELASFKLVSLKDVLGAGGVGLLGEVDDGWDPRA